MNNNMELLSDKIIRMKTMITENDHADTQQKSKQAEPAPVIKKRIAEQPPVANAKKEEPDRKPIPLNLMQLLRAMDRNNASDLHLSTGCRPVMRLDGDILTLNNHPVITEGELCSELIKITPERNWEEFDRTNDTDFGYEVKGIARFRCNIFRDHRGCGIVFRLIPSKILSIEDLNIPESFVNLCHIPKGLVLVTGPTGSGKSTTLAALIDHINRTQKKHIITVEDPIEFVYENRLSMINQREVNTHTSSFKSALRAALREDPDVILVGEMRDLETISIAMEMAVTGHLVFGTLHTSTAIATVNRIIDQFPANQQSQIRTMLADSLVGVCSQTLLKRKKGGRVGAYEILIGTIGVSNLIREGKNFQIATLMQTGKKQGMKMLNSALSELIEKGIVDEEEAMDKAIDKENLKTGLRFKEELREQESLQNQEKPLNNIRAAK
jgi:twitching motility protein PilT